MEKYEKILVIIISAILALGVVSFLDKTLMAGMLFSLLLGTATLLFLSKLGIEDKKITTFFVVVFIIHTAVVVAMHYSNFQPFANGAGDFVEYHKNAIEIYTRLQHGNFSVMGLERASHYYPVLIGYIYTFTVPNMLMGQLLNAWLMSLTALVSYFIVTAIKGSKKGALLVATMVAFYPSLLFFGGLMLKDALIVFLSLLGILITIQLIQKFQWGLFALLYLILGFTIHFRFYIGFAVLLTFIISWLLFSNIYFKKRAMYFLVMVALFGFLPQLFMVDDAGYWGAKLFKQYLNQKTISYYRESAYVAEPQYAKNVTTPVVTTSVANQKEPVIIPAALEEEDTAGSTFAVKTEFNNFFKFIGNYIVSFIYTIFGPFVWQIKYKRQLLSLIEVIPWYFLLFFIVKGAIKEFGRYYKNNYKMYAPLLIFTVLVLSSIALFFNNFGIITRIRIPAIICLLCFLPFSLKEDSVIYQYFEKIYSKISLKWNQKR